MAFRNIVQKLSHNRPRYVSCLSPTSMYLQITLCYGGLCVVVVVDVGCVVSSTALHCAIDKGWSFPADKAIVISC